MPDFGGSWSASKLDCVEAYATAYLKVMQQQHWAELRYIDAFAGRGKQAVKDAAGKVGVDAELDSFFGSASDRRDVKAFLEGSALRVLNASSQATRGFERYTFIDSHRPSCEELRAAVSASNPDVTHRIEFACEDANAALDRCLADINWQTTRALVFLDPFGLEVKWSTSRLWRQPVRAMSGICSRWAASTE